MHLSLNDALKYGTLRIPSRKVSAFTEGGNNDHRTYFANEVPKHPYAAEQATDVTGNTHAVVGSRSGASDSQGTNFVFAPLSNGHFLVHRDLGGEQGHVDSAILSPEQVQQWQSELDQFDGSNAASKNRHRFNQSLRDHLQNLLLPSTEFDAGDEAPLFQNKWANLPEAFADGSDLLPHELPKSLHRLLTDDSTPMERKGSSVNAGDDTLPHERPPEQRGEKADDRLPWEYHSLNTALKYGQRMDHTPFTDAALENPYEATIPKVYADHLQEQGEETLAEHIRQHSDQALTADRPQVILHDNPSLKVGRRPAVKVTTKGFQQGAVRVDTFHPSSSGAVRFSSMYSPADANRLLTGLKDVANKEAALAQLRLAYPELNPKAED